MTSAGLDYSGRKKLYDGSSDWRQRVALRVWRSPQFEVGTDADVGYQEGESLGDKGLVHSGLGRDFGQRWPIIAFPSHKRLSHLPPCAKGSHSNMNYLRIDRREPSRKPIVRLFGRLPDRVKVEQSRRQLP